ncbi:MAG: hypothetical protein IT374_27510 [Polyangiaceae bacterium]|nr:hypothetical protein [Polyangiaceae bacterium]
MRTPLAAAALALFTLTACGNNNVPPRSPEPPATPPAEAGNNQGSTPPPLPPPESSPETAPLPPQVAEQEWAPGKYMGQAIRIVGESARQLEQRSKFGFAKEHASLMGAYLKKGEVIDITLSLKQSREYAFIGGGSQYAIDVDLGILAEEDGKVLKADMEKDSAPAFRWRPPADGSYKVRLKLQDSRASGDFVALAVMHEGGYAIPARNLLASFESTLSMASAASAKARKLGKKGLVFHENKNWSFFGVVLRPGEMNTFSGFKFDGSAIVMAGGDSGTDNLDLFIKDSANNILDKDDAPDANPLVVFKPTDTSARYKIGVKQASQKGATLATVAVLDIEE